MSDRSPLSSIPENAFDPTSNASMIGLCLLIAAILCMACSGYQMGKFRDRRDEWPYQSSLWAICSGITLFGVALLSLLLFD
jgi:hypothetical protein